MHQKSTLPTAEVTVLPVRPGVVGQGEARQPAVPIESEVSSPLTEGAEGAETYQADRALHAMLARLSGGISPAALLLAYTDWLSHLAASPQRQIEIAQEALVDTKRFFEAAQRFLSPGQGPWSLIEPQPQDKRFGRPEWEQPPFNLMAQCDHGRAWRRKAERGDRRVFGPADAGFDVAFQFCRDQSGSAAENIRERRQQFRARLAEFLQRLDAPGVGGH